MRARSSLGPWIRIAVAASGVWLAACEKEEPKSPDDIDSSQGTYAAEYPDKLARMSKDIRAHETKAKEDIGSMPTFSEQLSDDVPTDKALAIIEAADKAGRDGGYAEEVRKMAAVQLFFEQEKDALAKKVGGAVTYTAQQKKCDADLWSPVSSSLKDGFDERIKERLHEHNDAFLLIERDREALGKKNAAALGDEADKIAEASYYVHAELPDKKKRLDYAVLQIPVQKANLEKLIKEEREHQTKDKLKPEDQKSSESRVKEWEAQLSALDTAGQEAQANQKDLEDRIKSLTSDYDAGYAALKDSVRAGKKK
jgi:hypothetical protein